MRDFYPEKKKMWHASALTLKYCEQTSSKANQTVDIKMLMKPVKIYIDWQSTY